MIFQAAHAALLFKQLREQRKMNKSLREKGTLWFGNVLTSIFYLLTIITIALMFARTVALQVAKLAILNGKSATKETMKYFTPDYRTFEGIYNRNCMTTVNGTEGYSNIAT